MGLNEKEIEDFSIKLVEALTGTKTDTPSKK